MKAHRFSILGFILVAILVITLPLIVFFSQQRQETRERAAGTNCTSTGVGTNADGTHFFSWLHVDAATNTIRDENGCIAILRGIVEPAAFGPAGTEMTKSEIDLLTKNIHLNYWRLNLHPFWWTNNVYVPAAINSITGQKGMKYQDWIMQLIGWMKADGLYVEIDKGPQFTEPPCGNDGHGTNISFCPSQDVGSLEAAGTPKTGDPDPADPNSSKETSNGDYIDPAIAMWTDIASKFKNDPAIWYDPWNEGHPIVKTNPGLWQSNMNTLINTIRSQNTNSLIMVYTDGDDVNSNIHFTQPNILADFHVYPGAYGSSTTSWPSAIQPLINYEEKAGHAIIFNEWGGSTGAITEPYNTNINSYLTTNNFAGSNYEGSNLYDKSTMQLNLEGVALAKDNVSLPWNSFNGSSGTPTSTPIPSSTTPTVSVTPTPTLPTNSISFFLTICPHGLGNCGDNANPSSVGNTNPLHTTRNITLSITDKNNNPVAGSPFSGQVNYVPSSQNFQGTVSVTNIPNGQYFIAIKMDGFLTRQFQGVVSVSQGQQINMPEISLVTGDIAPVPGKNGEVYGDNQLNISDYNVLISCFGQKMNSPVCLNPPTQLYAGSDIDDDGTIDGADYNLFVRELSVQQGE